MNINAALVKKLRTEKSWSQEELATVSGLNLRTVQRIESEATASLQSKKALAAAFDMTVKDLEHTDPITMQTHEYKTTIIEFKQGFFAGLKPAKLPDLTATLNKEAKDGWRLVQILPPDLMMSNSIEKLVVIFERPLSA